MQDEDRPLFDRELPERAFQLVAIGESRAAIRCRWPSHRQDPDVGFPVTGPLRFVVAGMDEDSMDPRLEAVRIPKVRKPPPGENSCSSKPVSFRIFAAKSKMMSTACAYGSFSNTGEPR